jgi:hypothetical protein
MRRTTYSSVRSATDLPRRRPQRAHAPDAAYDSPMPSDPAEY